jgi:hypothetical protein
MITAVCFLLLVATVPLLGGRLSRLGQIRLKAWWTIAMALFIQVLLIEVFAGTLGGVLAAIAHLLSYGFALVFVWHNRKVTGMALIVTGGLLNLSAIAANGGVMPAQRSALEMAGIIVDSPEFENSAVIDNARLWFLGDVFAIPEGVPFANVFSIGDIILVLGGGITVHTVARSRLGVLLTRLDPLNRFEPDGDERDQRIAELEEQLRLAAPRLELLERLETIADSQFETPEAMALRAAIDLLEQDEQRHRQKLSALQAEYESLHHQLKGLRHEVLVDFERRLLAVLPPPSEHQQPYATERRRAPADLETDFEHRHEALPTPGS